MMLAARGLVARIRMTEDETYRMVSEHFKENKVIMPDGADLVDEIGIMLSKTRLIDYYDNVPYIR